MREIVLDTETTGLDAAAGDRIVELACVELVNHVPSGRVFQRYLNPDRAVSAAALEVHGLNTSFLNQQPRFADIVAEWLAFIGDAPLVIHNAEFDLAFLDAELKRIGQPALSSQRKVIDTLQVARRKFPGAQASLDALCRRFGINDSARTKHGALVDCELLAQVYLELIGGRQVGLDLTSSIAIEATVSIAASVQRVARPHAPTSAELAAHAALLTRLKEPIWSL